MKPTRLLVLLVVGLFLSACIVAQDQAGRQRHRLEGTWYAGGSPDKLCLILSTPQGLEVRNESGGRSVLVYDPPNSVRASTGKADYVEKFTTTEFYGRTAHGGDEARLVRIRLVSLINYRSAGSRFG
jgi:hypothetical protein